MTETSYQHAPDRPWIFRTYAGHSTAAESNALYRKNLAKGQTGLSIAFDLPTQTAYDADHVLSRGEVGKVGVPIGHLGDMRTLPGCLRSMWHWPMSRAQIEVRFAARRRTISSRNIFPAALMCSRPSRACG